MCFAGGIFEAISRLAQTGWNIKEGIQWVILGIGHLKDFMSVMSKVLSEHVFCESGVGPKLNCGQVEAPVPRAACRGQRQHVAHCLAFDAQLVVSMKLPWAHQSFHSSGDVGAYPHDMQDHGTHLWKACQLAVSWRVQHWDAELRREGTRAKREGVVNTCLSPITSTHA